MMPRYDGEPQLAAVPLSLTMGWTKSLPTFSAASEMAADLANAQLTTRHNQLPCHHLEHLASIHDNWESPSVMIIADTAMLVAGTTPLVMFIADTAHQGLNTAHLGLDPSLMPTSVPPCKPEPELQPSLLLHVGPVAHVDVYVDDFIGLAQGS